MSTVAADGAVKVGLCAAASLKATAGLPPVASAVGQRYRVVIVSALKVTVSLTFLVWSIPAIGAGATFSTVSGALAVLTVPETPARDRVVTPGHQWFGQYPVMVYNTSFCDGSGAVKHVRAGDERERRAVAGVGRV